ncbi:hypothetical protein BBR47_25100 [Brevibacillus brevis NBRC 100599]|uniref:Uncharacterized protein n=1 Tax=Brevibacillus brevis (strain 47 / JCM 6285 / NBRC 100599) TaxID=358681 RepID=C0ZCH8_BREBN|nr:hypothetical protein BBR47_25100 [Brevibacillus brevis NBRC 100599]
MDTKTFRCSFLPQLLSGDDGENEEWVCATIDARETTILPRRRGIPVTETQVCQEMWFVAKMSRAHLLGVYV